MFGRLRVPLETRPAVLVPVEAVQRVGQLEMVQIVEEDRIKKLLVTTGVRIDGDVEILSGLRGDEQLLLSGSRP
jgi:HlyD family secretion protein